MTVMARLLCARVGNATRVAMILTGLFVGVSVTVTSAQNPPRYPPPQVTTNYRNAADTAAKSGRLLLLVFTQPDRMPELKTWEEELWKNNDVARASQRYVVVRFTYPWDDKLGKKYNIPNSVPHVVTTLPNGDMIGDKHSGLIPPTYLAKAMDDAIEQLEIKVIEQLSKQIASNNVAAQKTALAQLGQLTSNRAAEELIAAANNNAMNIANRVVAVQGIAKIGKGAEKIVPLLGHENAALRNAAIAAVRAKGLSIVSQVLAELDSDNPEHRASCFTVASGLTPQFKKCKTAAFWKTGTVDERKTLAQEWREWWENNRPPMEEKVN